MPSLLAPWFLLGLAALAVPVLVHLTHRERKTVLRFPSLMFLERIPYQSVKRQRIRNLLLFALRCAAVALLVLAFARPFLERRSALLGASTGARDVVVLLDRSYSMAYGDRWTRARSAVKSVVDGLSGEDRGAIVYFDDAAVATGSLTSDRSTLLAALDSVRPTAGGTRYDAALRVAGRILGDTARERREVVLISDAQRAGWSRRELPSLPSGVRLVQVNVGDSMTSDVAVTSVEVRNEVDRTGAQRHRATVIAWLANRSADSVSARTVTLELNGRVQQSLVTEIPPNGRAMARFDSLPLPEGVSRGTVRAGADALEPDNVFHFTLTRTPSLPVIVFESSSTAPGAGLFVGRALSIGDRPSFDVSTVRGSGLTRGALRGARLVILDDAPVPGGEGGRRLLDYVSSGGGLLIALGAHSRPDDWPELADRLLPRPAAPIDRLDAHGATLGFLDRTHPIFDVFSTPHSGDFSAARFYRYWNIAPAPGDRELARFDDGHVALLERRVGRGRVLVLTSALDGVWSDFPLQPLFLPVLREAATYAAGYSETRPWAVVGDVTTIAGSSTPAVVVAPSGTRLHLGTSGESAPLQLAEQGFYEIRPDRGTSDSARVVAVNVNLAESDLAPFDTALFAAAVAPRATATGSRHPDETVTPAELERRQRTWWFLLLAALLVLGAETVLSNRLPRQAR
ncbi:MAG TPA: BatA and WFA domain-containing protein [Gemmatimonadaceae bacterium]|nr:BatA and WFA domain-containing protein [Gemmatimonadaceae bacterium]